MPSTANYTWSRESLLGTGAVGEVYVGYHISTGEAVAIKVMKNFKPSHLEHLLSLQERELEVLKKLDHPNIVKLIGVENEKEVETNQRKIIIMELCTGGSLYNLLADPENIFGLDDEEFLNVLRGITAGMEKLHSESIVHRDIKPGNIMRYIGEDGRTTYKLIDFGAARELHCDQEFESIYGTEEYLHPELYEKAFLNKDSEQAFKNSVDLWSIGATLYHVASGMVPFQSYEGRRDRGTMYRIIAGKKSGDISGVQRSRSGEIVYDNHLPMHCLMSMGLRPAVENLLARLLEVDEKKNLSFQEFFEMANKIVKKKIVPVFDCGTTDVLKVYMDPDCSFQGFQSLLTEQNKVAPSGQMLLHENLDFAEQFGGDDGILSCREIVDTNPVYLFYECSVVDHKNLDDVKYSMPTRDYKTGSKSDMTFSKYCCESLHYIRRNVIKSQLRQRLIDSGAVMLIRFLSRRYDKFFAQMEHFSNVVQLLSNKIETSRLLVGLMEKTDQSKTVSSAKSGLCSQSDLCQDMINKAEELQDSSSELEHGLQTAVSLWVGEKPSCKEEDCCASRMEYLLKTVEEIRLELCSDPEGKKLDMRRRKLKGQKLENCCKSARSLIEDHCQKNAKLLIDCFLQFLKQIWPRKEALEKLEKNLGEQFEGHRLLVDHMKEWNEKLTDYLKLPKMTAEPSSLTPKDSSLGDSLYVQKDKLLVRKSRRTSMERKYVKQLFSISTVSNATLAQKVLTVAEENNKSLEELITRISKTLPSDVDGKATSEATTYQDKPVGAHEDMTMT